MHKLFFILLFISATAAAQTPKTPLEFNDKIVSYIDTMYTSGEQWGTVFNEASTSGKYATLKTVTDKMETYINRSISSLTTMQDVKNSKQLRLSVIEFLQFEKSLINKAFRPFEKFNSETSDETKKAAIDNLVALSKEEDQCIKKILELQTKYGAENGFSIEDDKEDGN